LSDGRSLSKAPYQVILKFLYISAIHGVREVCYNDEVFLLSSHPWSIETLEPN